MATVLDAFPDVQAMLREVLSGMGTFGIQTDAHLGDKLPFIAAAEIGGTNDDHTDYTEIDVDVFTTTYAGKALAEQVRQRILAGPHRTTVGVIDRATTSTRPHEVPYTDGSQIRRWTATYRVRSRR